jgi:hypothetical protein
MNIDPVAAAIRQAEHAEAETRYRLQLAREMYQAGHRAGFESGYRQANADEAAAWAKVARPVAHGMSHAELEDRRWGPGGRAHFADPRPGDFPGRGIEALTRLYGTEAQKEAQAG